MASLTVIPSNGPTYGGTYITITGTSPFIDITSVTIGGNEITNINYLINEITGYTSVGLDGSQLVVVTLSTEAFSGVFTYDAPTITTIEPPSGPLAGGQTIRISGTDIIPDPPNEVLPAIVKIGDTPVTFTIDNGTLLTNTLQSTVQGEVVISVIWPGPITITSIFTYVAEPTVTTITPDTGIILGGTIVTITGTNFINLVNPSSNTVLVTIGGNSATSISINATYTVITATIPAGTDGPQLVIVQTAGGSASIRYVYFTPTITNIYPTRGPTNSGTIVTLTGTHLLNATSITNTSSFSVTDTLITATLSGGSGLISIDVTWVVLTSFTISIPYTYSDIPIITLVNPNGGPTYGGTFITITGTSFVPFTVTIDGVPITNLFVNPNTFAVITGNTPPGTIGQKELIITNTGGQKAFSFFTYNPPIPPVPYGERGCVLPPYNATNFTSGPILSILQSYAKNSPNYPWDTGTNAQQIYKSRQNFSLFNTVNQKTIDMKTANDTRIVAGLPGNMPYPTFKTQAERVMYLQGLTLTAARNKITGENPSAPMGVPCSTIYGIINS